MANIEDRRGIVRRLSVTALHKDSYACRVVVVSRYERGGDCDVADVDRFELHHPAARCHFVVRGYGWPSDLHTEFNIQLHMLDLLVVEDAFSRTERLFCRGSHCMNAFWEVPGFEVQQVLAVDLANPTI